MQTFACAPPAIEIEMSTGLSQLTRRCVKLEFDLSWIIVHLLWMYNKLKQVEFEL